MIKKAHEKHTRQGRTDWHDRQQGVCLVGKRIGYVPARPSLRRHLLQQRDAIKDMSQIDHERGKSDRRHRSAGSHHRHHHVLRRTAVDDNRTDRRHPGGGAGLGEQKAEDKAQRQIPHHHGNGVAKSRQRRISETGVEFHFFKKQTDRPTPADLPLFRIRCLSFLLFVLLRSNPMTGFTSGLFKQLDAADFHETINGLAHVVNG